MPWRKQIEQRVSECQQKREAIKKLSGLIFAKAMLRHFGDITIVIKDKKGELSFRFTRKWLEDNSISKFRALPMYKHVESCPSKECQYIKKIFLKFLRCQKRGRFPGQTNIILRETFQNQRLVLDYRQGYELAIKKMKPFI